MSDSTTVIRDAVQERYARLALAGSEAAAAGCCDGDACCEPAAATQDPALITFYGDLYTADTSWLPAEVTGLSLGCGDPITLAGLQPGQTVLDLGSGGGIDCFMAARQVGREGHVIGVDMTPEMLAKAERNREKVGLPNVEFRQGLIEALPVDSESVDVIISNCVINLSPDKAAVFREAYRVLKPGGRLAASDMVTLGRFTPEERADRSAWAGCISGAEDVADYVALLRAAGFREVSVRDKTAEEVELAGTTRDEGPARLFSARVTAVK
jgi:SAM-dependent methyltransferase